jgi:MSHA biogenesis protein MshJ
MKTHPLADLLDQLRAGWVRAARLFDARAPRERLLLSAAGAAVLLMLVNQLWLEPAWQAWSAARQQQNQAEAALQQLHLDAEQISAQQRLQTQQLQAELTSLRARVAQGELPTDARQQGLISAAEMLPLLEQLLKQHSGLRVRALQSLGRTVLGEAGPNTAPAASATGAGNAASPTSPTSPVIYRHGVELSVEGSYADLLSYLQALEALPQQLLWGSLQLKVEQYPQVLLTLRLHTLSLQSAWVEL